MLLEHDREPRPNLSEEQTTALEITYKNQMGRFHGSSLCLAVLRYLDHSSVCMIILERHLLRLLTLS